MLKNLAESMPRRLQAVIDAKRFCNSTKIQKFEILNFTFFEFNITNLKKLLFAFDSKIHKLFTAFTIMFSNEL